MWKARLEVYPRASVSTFKTHQAHTLSRSRFFQPEVERMKNENRDGERRPIPFLISQAMMRRGRDHEGGINQDRLTLIAELKHFPSRGLVARSCTLHGLRRISDGAYGNAPDVMTTQSPKEIVSWYHRTYISDDSNLLPMGHAYIYVFREKARTNSRVSKWRITSLQLPLILSQEIIAKVHSSQNNGLQV